jgi:hypothetical protein
MNFHNRTKGDGLTQWRRLSSTYSEEAILGALYAASTRAEGIPSFDEFSAACLAATTQTVKYENKAS